MNLFVIRVADFARYFITELFECVGIVLKTLALFSSTNYLIDLLPSSFFLLKVQSCRYFHICSPTRLAVLGPFCFKKAFRFQSHARWRDKPPAATSLLASVCALIRCYRGSAKWNPSFFWTRLRLKKNTSLLQNHLFAFGSYSSKQRLL